MTINPQKFLPASKIKSTNSTIKVAKIIPSYQSLYKKPEETENTGDISSIAKKVDIIANLVTSTASLKKKTKKETKKETQNQKREEKETRLEKKDNRLFPTSQSVSTPKTGFLDAINRFITFTLLGLTFKKLYPYLPQMLGFIKNINPIIKLFEVLAGNLFKGIVDFIDFGYKAHDTVRDFTKKLGGEGFQKTFDDFSKNLNTFVNLAIIAGMATMGGTDFGLGKKGGRGGGTDFGLGKKGGRGGGRVGEAQWRQMNNRGFRNNQGSTLSGERLLNPSRGRNYVNSHRDIMKRYFQRYGRDKFIQRFGQEGLEALPKGVQRGALQRGARSAFMGIAGKGGAKAVLKFTRPLLKRLPIVGALIDFGLSIALGEPLGRAAFKAIGAGILGVIGTGFGGPLGAILGGFAGDWAGGKLYDVLFGGQKNVDNTKQQIKTKKTGGKVTTRKGKVIGGAVKRTIRRVYTPTKPKQVKPGSSVGGDKKIKQFFPEPPKNQIGKAMDPYGFLTKTTKDMGSIPFFGSIFNIFGKVLLGDLPTKDDFKIIGSNMNAWINGAISKGILQGNLTSAFADGGLIDIEGEMRRNISGWVEKSVEELVKNKVTDAINELRKNLGMEPLSGIGDPSAYGAGMQGGFSPTGIQKEIYEYLLSKGLDDNKTLGIMANISRESGFRVDARQPDGPGIGLFQYSSAGRKEAFLKAVPNYATNWKGQIDYALKEDYAPQYLKQSFSSPQEAADVWMRKWERPREDIKNVSGPKKHAEYLASIPRSSGGRPVFPTGINLGTEMGNLQLAQQIANGFKVPLFSHVRNKPGDDPRSYHFTGKAMDFSNDAVGRGTPEQLKLAQELIRRFGSTAKEIFYTPLGFSIKDGKKVSPIAPAGHYNHVHVAFKKGGEIGKQKVKPLQKQAYYEEGSDSMIYILPIHIKEQIHIPVGNSRSSFPGSLNRSMYSRVSMQ